jgi:outer membrane immunogenic protein
MSKTLTTTRLASDRSFLTASLLTTTMLVCLATPAISADMPVKAAPKAPVYQWTGCYVGFNVGGGASGSNFSSTVNAGTHLVGGDPLLVSGSGIGGSNAEGLLAGGQVGCNVQSEQVVFGLEGDFDYFRSNPSFANNTNTLSDGVTPFTLSQSLTTNYLATIRPRVGLAADRNLFYLTGGVAFTRVSYSETYSDGAAPPGFGAAAASKSLVGWVAGAGWEHAITDNVIFRAEYLYAHFSSVNAAGLITDSAGGSNGLQGSGDLVVQVVRAGASFKF